MKVRDLFAKKIILLAFLSFTAIALGGTLGALDLYGFVNGQHAINAILLGASLLLLYLAMILVFILDFSDKRYLNHAYIFVSFFFGFTAFMVTKNPLLALGYSIIFFAFLLYCYQKSWQRSKLFVKFTPSEIFFPVLRSAFFYIFLLLALLIYLQTQNRIADQNLVNPRIVKTISQPIIGIINSQINSQIQTQFQDQLPINITSEQKVSIVRGVLNETVKSALSQNKTIFGFSPADIPIKNARISSAGEVDFSPVVEEMAPLVTKRLNEQIEKYAIFVPVAIVVIIILLLQPFLLPIQLVEAAVTSLIFKILIRIGFLRIERVSQEVETINI